MRAITQNYNIKSCSFIFIRLRAAFASDTAIFTLVHNSDVDYRSPFYTFHTHVVDQ